MGYRNYRCCCADCEPCLARAEDVDDYTFPNTAAVSAACESTNQCRIYRESVSTTAGVFVNRTGRSKTDFSSIQSNASPYNFSRYIDWFWLFFLNQPGGPTGGFTEFELGCYDIEAKTVTWPDELTRPATYAERDAVAQHNASGHHGCIIPDICIWDVGTTQFDGGLQNGSGHMPKADSGFRSSIDDYDVGYSRDWSMVNSADSPIGYVSTDFCDDANITLFPIAGQSVAISGDGGEFAGARPQTWFGPHEEHINDLKDWLDTGQKVLIVTVYPNAGADSPTPTAGSDVSNIVDLMNKNVLERLGITARYRYFGPGLAGTASYANPSHVLSNGATLGWDNLVLQIDENSGTVLFGNVAGTVPIVVIEDYPGNTSAKVIVTSWGVASYGNSEFWSRVIDLRGSY